MGWLFGYMLGSSSGRAAGRQSILDDVRQEGYEEGREKALDEARAALREGGLDPALAPGLKEARRRLGPSKNQELVKVLREKPQWNSLTRAVTVALLVILVISLFMNYTSGLRESISYPGPKESLVAIALDFVPILGTIGVLLALIAGVQDCFWEYVEPKEEKSEVAS